MREDKGGEDWEARKRASVAQLLFRCARLVNEQAMGRASERHGMALRASHTQVFPHIPLEEPGIRLTELARRLGISKQAVGQIIDELEGLGVVARVADAEDRRARGVVFTERGRRGLEAGLEVLAEIEAEIEAELGRARMRALHDALLALEELF